MNEDGTTTSADRDVLRAVERYFNDEELPAGVLIVGVTEVARLLGLRPKEVRRTVQELGAAGLLSARPVLGRQSLMVTDAGRADLARNKSAYLLVQVDDKFADDTEYLLARMNGVEQVHVHGPGCCCKNCPWKGDHG